MEMTLHYPATLTSTFLSTLVWGSSLYNPLGGGLSGRYEGQVDGNPSESRDEYVGAPIDEEGAVDGTLRIGKDVNEVDYFRRLSRARHYATLADNRCRVLARTLPW